METGNYLCFYVGRFRRQYWRTLQVLITRNMLYIHRSSDKAKYGYIRDRLQQNLRVFRFSIASCSTLTLPCATNPQLYINVLFYMCWQLNIYFRRRITREKIMIFLYVLYIHFWTLLCCFSHRSVEIPACTSIVCLVDSI